MNNTIAVATNLAFWFTAFLTYRMGLPEITAWCIALGIGSGFHHYNLGKRFMDRELSVLADYFPMYGVCLAMLCYFIGLNYWLAIVGALIIIWFFRHSRIAIGVCIGLVMASVGIFDSPEKLASVIPWAVVAFFFNYLGDYVHEKHHNYFHGFWHIIIAYVIYLALNNTV